jgi:hypothetical protein
LKAAKEKAPTLRNVVPADLWRFDRLEALYGQAVAAGWIPPSEAQALDFIAAAVRARQVEDGDPVRIFVATVRQHLWHHITLDQEDHARRTLTRFRDQDPDRFRVIPTRLNGHSVKVVFQAGHQPLSDEPPLRDGSPIGNPTTAPPPNFKSVKATPLRANDGRGEKGFVHALRRPATGKLGVHHPG